MKNLIKFITIVTIISASILLHSVSASAEYSYPYDEESGWFDIPYTVVSREDLQKPDNVIGEIRETDIDSGILSLELSDGKRIETSKIVFSYKLEGGRDGGYESRYRGGTWSLYDSEDRIIQTLSEVDDRAMIPVVYKSRLFAKQTTYYKLYNTDPSTLEYIDDVSNIGTSLSPYESEPAAIFEKSLYQSGGVLEITPGSFVSGNKFSYLSPLEIESGSPIQFMTFTSDGHFAYSRDGIYFIEVKCPYGANKFLHYTVYGNNCIILRITDDDSD